MNGSKIIKVLLIEQNHHVGELAEVLGIKVQSVYNKLARDSFTFEEMVKIADFLDCDIQFVVRNTGKVIK